MTTRWRRGSLRRRITVTSAILIVVVLVGMTLGFSWTLNQVLTQGATDTARSQVRQFTALIESGNLRPGRISAADAPGGTGIEVVDSTGALVATVGKKPRATPPALAPGKEAVTRQGEDAGGDALVSVWRGVAATDGKNYVVAVSVPLDVESRAVATSTFLLAIGSLILIVLSIVATARLVGRSLRPVRRINAEVSRISQAGGTARVTVPPGGDEITELAKTMNAMLDRLARADSATRRFVSDASHELRSPLATLRLHLETADSPEDVDLEIAREETIRLGRLVDDLLLLAKADDQGLRIASDEVDVDDVVDAEVRRLRSVTSATVTAAIVPAQTTGDAARISQIVRNLLDNAARHTTGGVAVTMEARPDSVTVHVDNDGTPVTPERRELVFERFYRADDSRGRDDGGSGLGLAISRSLAQAHGGTVTAGTSETGGCRFTLTLPPR